MKQEELDERQVAWAALSAGGVTFKDIGEAVGLSRERVRQIVPVSAKEQGRSGGLHLDPLRLLREIRTNPGLMSLSATVYRIDSTINSARRVLDALGLTEAVERLFRLRRWRRLAKRREVLRKQNIEIARNLWRQLGRSPTRRELVAHGVFFGNNTARWQSPNEILRAAGLPTRPPGGAGHLRRRKG